MASKKSGRTARGPQKVTVRRTRTDDAGVPISVRETVGPRKAEELRKQRDVERSQFQQERADAVLNPTAAFGGLDRSSTPSPRPASPGDSGSFMHDPMDMDSGPGSLSGTFQVPVRDAFLRMRERQAARPLRQRSWAERRRFARLNWDAQRDVLVDAYLKLLHSHTSSGAPPPLVFDSERNTTLSGHVRNPGEVLLVDLSGVKTVSTAWLGIGNRNVALLKHGYLGSSPVAPEVAFSVRLLLQYIALNRRARTGKQNFIRALCDILNVPDSGSFLARFSDAVDAFRTLVEFIDNLVSAKLGRDGDWRRKNGCPPCSYKCEGEPPLRFARQVTMDGNNSQKRFTTAALPDDIRFSSHYFIPPAVVNECADEVQQRGAAQPSVPVPPVNPTLPQPATVTMATLASVASTSTETDAPAPAVTTAPPSEDAASSVPVSVNTAAVAPTPAGGAAMSDLDAGVDATGNVQSDCADRWRNARPEALKGVSWEALEETGIFACVCRHGFIVAVLDMIRSGELAKYGLAIDKELIRLFGDEGVIQSGYDINCAHAVTASRSSFGAAYRRCIHAVVGSFHGHAHGRTCQLCYHPLYVLGSGREPFEGCEQFFSFTNRFAFLTRHSTAFNRHRELHGAFLTWDSDKYAAMGTLLLSKFNDAQSKLAESEAILAASHFSFTDADFERMIKDELEFLKSRPSNEPVDARDKTLDGYCDTLSQLWKAEAKRASLPPPSARARNLLRAWNHAPAIDKSYIAANRAVTALDIQAAGVEQQLDIDRWTRDSVDYKRALAARTKRHCDTALHELEVAVISRIFELEKLNMRNTGYKMRKYITREIGRRTGAVKKLVEKYNRLASAVQPTPRPTITYEQVIDAAFLADFPLLRYDTGEAPWAQPLFRSMTRAWADKQRAVEELARVRTESVRIRTWIRDEEALLDAQVSVLASSDDARDRLLAHELDMRAQYRFDVHCKILRDLLVLDKADGRQGPRLPGTRVGHQPVPSQAGPALRPRTRGHVLRPLLLSVDQSSLEYAGEAADDEDGSALGEEDAVELDGLYNALNAIAA